MWLFESSYFKWSIEICVNSRNDERLAQENPRITYIKIFDNSTQSNASLCYDKPCPGMMLQTPNGCYCNCGNDYDLNASGTQCLRQAKTTAKNECAAGREN